MDPSVHTLAALLSITTGVDVAPTEDIERLRDWLLRSTLVRQIPALAGIAAPDLSDVPEGEREAALAAWLEEAKVTVGWERVEVLG